MKNAELDKLTKKWMDNSKLDLSSTVFDDKVMAQISLEANKKEIRKSMLKNFLIFTGIELIILVLLLILLIVFPGYHYFASAIKSSFHVFQKIGNLALRYDYLILSFIVVGLLDWLMNKKKISLDSILI